MITRKFYSYSPALIGAVGTSYDEDTIALLGRMSVEPDDTRKGLIDDLIVGLKSDGLWSKLDFFLMLAAHDSQAGLLDWKMNRSATNNATIYEADKGFTANVTANSTIDFGINLTDLSLSATKDNVSIGAWCNKQGTADNFTVQVHITAGIRMILAAASLSGNYSTFRMNDGTSDNFELSTGTRTGHRTAVRTGSTVKKGYFNGVEVASLTTASTVLSNENVKLYQTQGGGYNKNDRLACAYIGQGFSNTEAANLHSRLNTFLTAIGAN